jgi:hypothetical protein
LAHGMHKSCDDRVHGVVALEGHGAPPHEESDHGKSENVKKLDVQEQDSRKDGEARVDRHRPRQAIRPSR